MRGELRKDLVGDTSAHEAGALTAIGRAAKAALLSRASLVATAIALVLALSWGLAAFLAVPAVFMVGLAGRLLALRSEAFDSAGDKVLEFESAVLVKVGE